MTLLLLAGAITGLTAPAVLRRLPEPGSGEDKVPYRALATWEFAWATGACAVAALAVVAARLPVAIWPVWIPLATLGVLLAGIDAVTTWLPLRLTRILWAATLISATVTLGLVDPGLRGGLAMRMVIGAIVVGAFFWAFWRWIGGLGFGDVRLAPVLGAVTASVSWQILVLGLLIGTGLGALHGVVRQVRSRAGPFPYGPSLIAGAFVAVAVTG